MVLILLGLVVAGILIAKNMSVNIKERLPVTMYMDEDLVETEGEQLCEFLKDKPYVLNPKFTSKEQVLEEETKRMGTNPAEFVGGNPYQPQIDFQLTADFAENDSLKWISDELAKLPKVTEITYPKDLIESINRFVRIISLVLLVLAALLLFVSLVLINNTVKLGIYSRRFNIHTMKLVGASWGFIRKPFIKQAIGIGLVASIIANLVLLALWAYFFQVKVNNIITWPVVIITALSVLLFGVIITTVCSGISVNRFLKMKAGELYKI
jgi:cell division transport system permease protein